ncbi:MAG TPA: hypothetical protein VH643_12955 [Gemmataceae bacterium]|jgi:hypothetical protein
MSIPPTPMAASIPAAITEPQRSLEPHSAAARRVTLCALTFGNYLPYFRRCLESLLAAPPQEPFELRLGFNDAPTSFAYAVGRLGADGAAWMHTRVPGGVERFTNTGDDGMPVWLWHSPVNLYKEPMARRLFHDVPLTTEYVLWFDDDSYVEPGWWEQLRPLLERQVDYIGQPWWVYYLPGQEEMIRAQPWYRGVPFARQDGRTGINFMTGGFLAVRSERLREANFPDTGFWWKGRTLQQYGGDTLLGEIARQQGWTWAKHDTHVRVNVDLAGRHPAPRRGGVGRQFGSDLDVAIR